MKRLIFVFIIMDLAVTGFCQNLDIRLLRSVYTQEDVAADGFFRVASESEVYIVAGLPAGLAVAGLIGNDDEMLRKAAVMAAGEAVNELLKLGLKYTINRERPFDSYSDIVPKISVSGPSFPSGHTSSAFETATSISLAYPEWYIITPAYLWAGTVAWSRMHLGVHYPSDILAGALIGSGSAYLTYKINQKLNFRKSPRPVNSPR